MEDYLQTLNHEQLEAVLHSGKPLLILAGAGSGKTRVITTKIAYCIRELGFSPYSILAVTFTNKAAREMAERACAIDERAAQVMMRTFHSFGAWFLRRYAEKAGLINNFTIYDDGDSQSLVSKILTNAGGNFTGGKADARLFARNIALAKDYLYSPESDCLSLINHTRQFPKIYAEYERLLSQSGNVDFGDLIKKPVEILNSSAELAGYIRGRFRVILVDEYQDANIAQFELLKALYGNTPGDEPYLCVVGDDDQSIYRFRGAEVKNILQFRKQFEGAGQIKLERNYRSRQEILSLANTVIAHNTDRLGKTLTAERGGGARPQLIYVDNQESEAVFCAELIRQSVKKGAKYSDWAILYRTNAQSVNFEGEFLHRKIPYRVIGSLKFYEREEIKDALSLLAFTANPRNEVAFRRIVNKPARGIGKMALEKITVAAAAAAEAAAEAAETAAAVPEGAASPVPEGEKWNLESACITVKNTLGAKAKKGLEEFLEAIQYARALLNGEPVKNKTAVKGAAKPLLRAGDGLAVCVAALLNDSGLSGHYHDADEDPSEQRLSNLQELVNNAVVFPRTPAGLIAFLDQIELDKSLDSKNAAFPDGESEEEDNRGQVNLITLHNTKGMEFRRVIITACEQGLFPRNEKKGEDLEEERRLFYVGVTRAMDELYFTCAESRRVFGQFMYQTPSIFLKEAGTEFLEKIDKRLRAGASLGGLTRNAGAGGVYGAVPGGRAPRVSSDGKWAVGDGLFHDDEGYGEVYAIAETEDGPVIKARFETGRVRQFLSKAQSGSFMKIRE